MAFCQGKLASRGGGGGYRFLFCRGKLFAPGMHQLSKSATNASLRSKTYSAICLVHCLSFAGMLQNSSAMLRPLKRSLDILLPKNLADMVKNSYLSSQAAIPSGSVLSRFRVVLDCSFMLWMRDYNDSLAGKPHLIRNLLSDSSPQGHENWQLTEVYTIEEPVTTADIVDEILQLQQKLSMIPASVSDMIMCPFVRNPNNIRSLIRNLKPLLRAYVSCCKID
jgi:hypothetical protein